MKISRKIHSQIRLQNLTFSVLFVAVMGLLGWLSTRYSTQSDWTAGGRHTLSEASRKVLALLDGPVEITAFAREDRGLRDQIDDQIGRFRRHDPQLSLRYVNPDTQPDKVRELGITVDGELVVDYRGRSERVQQVSETALTNALQRLLQAKDQQIALLTGHGERAADGRAAHDLGQFVDELGRKGIKVVPLNLAVTPAIPDKTAVLVVAGPTTNLLPGEVSLIRRYVEQGRNLLWLADPGSQHGLGPLTEKLGLRFVPGTVVDASTQLFGITDPTFVLVAEYPSHPITSQFQKVTVFPAASALDRSSPASDGDFAYESILSTLPRSWTETGTIEGKIRFDSDKGEKEGPLAIGYALTRAVSNADAKDPKRATKPSSAGDEAPQEPESAQQRIVVVGDGDFLSNAYLGEGGNLQLGLNILQWLTGNDRLIDIPPRTVPDRSLNIAESTLGMIAIGFLFLVPLALFGVGALVWFQRRRR